MGCLKLSYYNEQETLDTFRKNLKVVYAKRGFSEKKGLNYSTFGSLMPGRYSGGSGYRYGYQGSEKDDEITGVEGAHMTTLFREIDTRLGRMWSVDPKAKIVPGLSSYNSMGNNPIYYNDVNGDLFGSGKKRRAKGKFRPRELRAIESGAYYDPSTDKFRRDGFEAIKRESPVWINGTKQDYDYNVFAGREVNTYNYTTVGIWAGKMARRAELKSNKRFQSVLKLNNGSKVNVTFLNTKDGTSSNQEVNPNLVLGVKKALNEAINNGAEINHISITATTNGSHSTNSNHYKGTAVDINQINGVRLTVRGADELVTALQNAFENVHGVNENFGPAFEKKKGTGVVVGGHHNHLHFSITP